MYNKKDVHSMARKQRLMIRLTDDEKQRLEYAAKRKGVSMSELIQDYCKRLPKPPTENDEDFEEIDSVDEKAGDRI